MEYLNINWSGGGGGGARGGGEGRKGGGGSEISKVAGTRRNICRKIFCNIQYIIFCNALIYMWK